MTEQLASSPDRMRTCRLVRQLADSPATAVGEANRRYQPELDALTALGADPFIGDYGIGPILTTTCGPVRGAFDTRWLAASISDDAEGFTLSTGRRRRGHWSMIVETEDTRGSECWVMAEGDDLVATYQRAVWEAHRNLAAATPVTSGRTVWELTMTIGARVEVTRYDSQQDGTEALLDYVAHRSGHSTPVARRDTDHHPQIRDYFNAHPDEGFYLTVAHVTPAW